MLTYRVHSQACSFRRRRPFLHTIGRRRGTFDELRDEIAPRTGAIPVTDLPVDLPALDGWPVAGERDDVARAHRGCEPRVAVVARHEGDVERRLYDG